MIWIDLLVGCDCGFMHIIKVTSSNGQRTIYGKCPKCNHYGYFWIIKEVIIPEKVVFT